MRTALWTLALGDHCKSGPRLSLQNRPMEGVVSGTSLFYSYSAAAMVGGVYIKALASASLAEKWRGRVMDSAL
jgi:hypothetical protein